MAIHGVDEDGEIKMSNQKTLLALMTDSDRLVCF